MLQRIGEFISACLQRADECSKAAASETNDGVRSRLLELEQQWQHLAKRFVLASHSLPPEVEKLPKDFPPE